jgi:tetratricopeptide (TPR) repeat protein
MNNLANTYSALGRLQDALTLKEKTLEFWRRVLPENHPDIGIACLNLGYSFVKVGDLHRALQCAREALRILQATLPPSHPHVQQAQQLVCHCESDTARRL